jgi:tRNA(Phe) wybutosine-synthesizing methylase Tyw3
MKNDIRRITIILESDVEAKLRKKQASIIAKTHRSLSFSKLINDLLRKA